MDAQTSSGERLVPFKSPKKFLADLDAAVTADVVMSSSDVALIVENGVIKDVAIGNSDLMQENYADVWRGKKWTETVTVESQSKIEDLLRAAPSKKGQWRQVNHPSVDGIDVPIRYTAVRTKTKNRIVALGRDLRSLSALQQRLIEAHQGLERDYDRLREAEGRYRLLFQSVSDAVLVVNAQSNKIDECNPAAATFFAEAPDALVGASFSDQFLKKSQRSIEAVLNDALYSGSAISEDLKLKGGKECKISVSPFRHDDDVRLIVRIVTPGDEHSSSAAGGPGLFHDILESLPDGLVVTDLEFRILEANRSFSEMTRLSGSRQAIGRRFGDFVGRSSTDLNVLVSSIKSHGSVRNFSTVLRDQFGLEERVEVSAVEAPAEHGEVYGFSIRSVARRLESSASLRNQLPKSVDQLTDLVGKVSLKDIVRESSDLIEKLCIEAALEITDDNRASAAEMLGLSRQGLYSKLKRFDVDS
ncbi:MAG: transcriptional regulator PpsR [Pseudomonadota bacterium]